MNSIYFTEREKKIIKPYLERPSAILEKLNELRTCSKYGEEYEVLEHDIVQVIRKLECLTEKELQEVFKNIRPQ